jgi:hypothetical protein
MPEAEYQPGDPAPVSGVFHEVNIFGTPTVLTAQVEAGDPLPGAPVGFHWVPGDPARRIKMGAPPGIRRDALDTEMGHPLRGPQERCSSSWDFATAASADRAAGARDTGPQA